MQGLTLTKEKMTEAMEVDSHEDVKVLVKAMNDAILKQDTASLKNQLQQVHDRSQEIVDFVVPILFEPDDKDENTTTCLKSSEALSLVGCLVSLDASTYLKPVSRKVKHEALIRASSEKPMMLSVQLLSVIVSQLNGNDVEVSSNATEALLACCRKLGPSISDPAIELLLNTWNEAWNNMAQNKVLSSTVCVRCASAMVDLAALHDNIMQSVQSKGAAALLLQMVSYELDPLLQMTCLDLLERMATIQPMHHNRSQWLCSEPVLEPLLTMAGAHDGEDPDPILGGPALRVLATICRLGQQDSSLFSLGGKEALLGFHRALHNFQGTGELDRLAIIDAISSFASASPDALELVLSDPVTRDGWLSLSVAQPKLKAAILTSIAMVIDPLTTQDGHTESAAAANVPSSNMAMKLFAMVGQGNNNSGDSTEVVLQIAKSPIPETRLGAYNLMRAVANTQSGSQVLLAHPGFYEFLLTREGETTKEGREGKYAVVQAVMNSPVKGLLAEDIVAKLDRILKEGPHYVPPIRPDLVVE
jgi:Proteasome non-ATPase 26S subunit